MPLRMNFPIVKTFPVIRFTENGEDKIRRASDGEHADGYISFRQATIQEAEARTGLASKRKWSASAEDTYTVIDDLNLDLLARTEVLLTLCATDIEYAEGKAEDGQPKYVALEFYEPTGYPKVKSSNQFNRWWDAMGVQWGRLIHECCMEVNPNWSLKR